MDCRVNAPVCLSSPVCVSLCSCLFAGESLDLGGYVSSSVGCGGDGDGVCGGDGAGLILGVDFIDKIVMPPNPNPQLF